MRIFFQINWLYFIKINYFSKKHVKRTKGYILPYHHVRFHFERGSKLFVNGNVHIGFRSIFQKRKKTSIYLKTNSSIHFRGRTSIAGGAFICACENAKIEFGNGSIGSDFFISAKTSITLGNDFLISREVIIRDHDGHLIIKKDYNASSSVQIGNRVWLCERCAVLKGSTIQNDCVVSFQSVVTGLIPHNSLFVKKGETIFLPIDGFRK